MKTSRRKFIKMGVLATAGVALIKSQSCASEVKPPKGIVGLQLYSIRDDMRKDPVASLKEVANMGYGYVEHAKYVNGKFYGFEPKEFRKILDDLGLKMISGHTVFNKSHWDEIAQDFSDAWRQLVDDAAILGQKYVVSPSMDMTMRDDYDDFKRYMDIFNKCGELCNKQGMKFGYHNHDFEFSESLNEQSLFDIMMTSMDPKLVVVQLDIGNLYNGGAVAIDVVKQYPGRFENLHVKDEIISADRDDWYEGTVLGEGIVNTKEVIDMATEIGGAEVYIIEQETYQGRTPMECAKANFEVMKKWGYV
jgi:sugar phosphate isomerase/epimerase